jgi:hypothetical protein
MHRVCAVLQSVNVINLFKSTGYFTYHEVYLIHTYLLPGAGSFLRS